MEGILVHPSLQAQNRISQVQNLIQTLMSGITPATRSRTSTPALVLDTLCLLLDILVPKLRPVSASPRTGVVSDQLGPPGHAQCPCLLSTCPQVSTQLYSTREKLQLASLVGTMIAYSLTYRQERMPDGQYVYRLEP